LLNHSLARHDPALVGDDDAALGLLAAVVARQARLLAQWMNIGFIHGVMNTDNMTISGESIDFGPCAFLETYDPQAVFSSIDHHGRYAFANQPPIAVWNLARLAEALLPLMPGFADDADACADRAMAVLDGFAAQFDAAWRDGQRRKLGLDGNAPVALLDDWLELLQVQRMDFTLAHWHLADAADGRDESLLALAAEAQPVRAWLARWKAACAPGAADAMRRVNPWIIARNHCVEAALRAASEEGDLTAVHELWAALREPHRRLPERAHLAQPAPAAFSAGYQTFCGT
jgi:uncharacterized protein YdiU (UPF0061 family)